MNLNFFKAEFQENRSELTIYFILNLAFTISIREAYFQFYNTQQCTTDSYFKEYFKLQLPETIFLFLKCFHSHLFLPSVKPDLMDIPLYSVSRKLNIDTIFQAQRNFRMEFLMWCLRYSLIIKCTFSARTNIGG